MTSQPVGTIQYWSDSTFKITADGGEQIPSYGQVLSREEYPGLYAVLKNIFGDGTEAPTEFRLPNFRVALKEGWPHEKYGQKWRSDAQELSVEWESDEQE